MSIRSNKISIIIPAFNESRNIVGVVEGIRKEFPDSKIVVVDDSTQEEYERTRKAIKAFKNLKLIPRGSKMGRGSAVIEGFRKGLAHIGSLYFFEMDADQSHEPTHLIRFLEKMLETNVDMVIGSRYVKGGDTGEITLRRKILSRIINRFLSMMFDIKLSDYTSGYRLYSRRAVEFLAKQKMKSTGFITLSEITYKLNKNGFKIVEVPVTITKRKYGKSTMGVSELVTSLVFIIRMRLER